ncbi:unnamed protein product, partial [Rotaria socialis]
CGNVKRVRIIYDNNTQQSRGFGFVNFNTIDGYNAALQLENRVLDGRELRIASAETKNSSSSSSNNAKAFAGASNSTAVSQATNKPRTQVVHCK